MSTKNTTATFYVINVYLIKTSIVKCLRRICCCCCWFSFFKKKLFFIKFAINTVYMLQIKSVLGLNQYSV